MEAIHIFEDAQLGTAPFHHVSTYQMDACCEYCGRVIKYNFEIAGADGSTFSVGRECVRKTGDDGLISVVEAEMKRLQREKRIAKQEAVWAEKVSKEANAKKNAVAAMTAWMEAVYFPAVARLKQSAPAALKGTAPFIRDMMENILGFQCLSSGQWAAIERTVKRAGENMTAYAQWSADCIETRTTIQRELVQFNRVAKDAGYCDASRMAQLWNC